MDQLLCSAAPRTVLFPTRRWQSGRPHVGYRHFRGAEQQDHRSNLHCQDRPEVGFTARGLDIAGLTHVFTYDLPDTPETYVHRHRANRQPAIREVLDEIDMLIDGPYGEALTGAPDRGRAAGTNGSSTWRSRAGARHALAPV